MYRYVCVSKNVVGVKWDEKKLKEKRSWSTSAGNIKEEMMIEMLADCRVAAATQMMTVIVVVVIITKTAGALLALYLMVIGCVTIKCFQYMQLTHMCYTCAHQLLLL